MKPFLDAGFLLALILEMRGSRVAWQITREMDAPLYLCHFQRFQTENRLLREVENSAAKATERASAAAALQKLGHYLDEQFFQAIPLEYVVRVGLAGPWQGHTVGRLP